MHIFIVVRFIRVCPLVLSYCKIISHLCNRLISKPLQEDSTASVLVYLYTQLGKSQFKKCKFATYQMSIPTVTI